MISFNIIKFMENKLGYQDSDGLIYPEGIPKKGRFISIKDLRALELKPDPNKDKYENEFLRSLQKSIKNIEESYPLFRFSSKFYREFPIVIDDRDLWLDCLKKKGLRDSDHSSEAEKLRRKLCFFLDFFIPSILLDDEIDGPQHYQNKYQIISDKARDLYLSLKHNIDTERFPCFSKKDSKKIETSIEANYNLWKDSGQSKNYNEFYYISRFKDMGYPIVLEHIEKCDLKQLTFTEFRRSYNMIPGVDKDFLTGFSWRKDTLEKGRGLVWDYIRKFKEIADIVNREPVKFLGMKGSTTGGPLNN